MSAVQSCDVDPEVGLANASDILNQRYETGPTTRDFVCRPKLSAVEVKWLTVTEDPVAGISQLS